MAVWIGRNGKARKIQIRKCICTVANEVVSTVSTVVEMVEKINEYR